MALGILKKLARGLARTRESLVATLQSAGGSGELDEEALEQLEASLLAADLGPELTGEVPQRDAGVAGGGEGA